MEFLTRRIGPLPGWAYIAIVVIGGVVIFILWRRYTNGSQAQSTSGLAGANPAYNPLDPNNDPNIDPNTGVPYQLEEALNPNTGVPYYYSNPNQPNTPNTPQTPTPVPHEPPPVDLEAQKDAQEKQQDTGEKKTSKKKTSKKKDHDTPKGSGPETSYTFEPIGATGQTAPLSNVAIDAYGVTGNSAINAAVQRIIGANRSLRGKNASYQPPIGTTIVLPTP